MNPKTTFLWHDYETFGTYPQLDRPAQFAAIRTNEALEPIGDPLNWYCQPAIDVFPHPVACLITGITPQLAREKGLIEADFANNIHAEMMEPNTCSVGYNSIRFDDEFSRNLFYRNFFDPYEREYKNNNSRWDLIDLARMCYALRPAGIEWPVREDGLASFRLEHLSTANNIAHEGAHEALSDVLATIALARLIRRAQPRLFDWALKMRDQRQVMKMLNVVEPQPFLHTSSRIPAARGCTSLFLPLAIYPDRDKSVIIYDLMADPESLIKATAEEISDRVFTPTTDLPEGMDRIPLKALHSNHVPMIAPASTLKGVDCGRIGLDPQRCFEHAERLKPELHTVRNKVMDVFKPLPPASDQDPDHMIYSGGFFSSGDRKLMTKVRSTDPVELVNGTWHFKNSRLPEMLFRYRARNYPNTLTPVEQHRWEEQRLQRLTRPVDDRQLNSVTFKMEILAARESGNGPGNAQRILDQVEAWGEEICRAQ